jgi:hypothetical protein
MSDIGQYYKSAESMELEYLIHKDKNRLMCTINVAEIAHYIILSSSDILSAFYDTLW